MRRGATTHRLIALVGAVILVASGCGRFGLGAPKERSADADTADADAADADIDGPSDGDLESDADHHVDADVEAECWADDECDDGVGCNGQEVCDSAVCQPGTAPNCDDGTECTHDECLEPFGVCLNEPDNALCDDETYCFGAGGSGCVDCQDEVCDPVLPQCGCAPDLACYPLDHNDRECRTPGTARVGENCFWPWETAPGHGCVSLFDGYTGPRTTVRLCYSDRDCIDSPNTYCAFPVSSVDGIPEPYSLCSSICDPARLTGCPDDDRVTCQILAFPRAAEGFLRQCRGPVGDGTRGEPCTSTSECGRGMACLDPDGVGSESRQCIRWCRPDDGCDAGLTCHLLAPPIVMDGVRYGACLPEP